MFNNNNNNNNNNNKPLITVITATNGNRSLSKAIGSVLNQSYDNIQHLIVVDGPLNNNYILDYYKDNPRIDIIYLPYSTGTNYYLSHRIYGASIYLAKGEFIAFLDDDNWFDYNHIESLLTVIEEGNDWAFSFRKIYDSNNNYICNDDCESLGKWPSFIDDRDYLVDTSCYLLPLRIAVQSSSVWYEQRGGVCNNSGPDRNLTYTLNDKKNNLIGNTTGLYTLNYKTGSNELSVDDKFFIEGNRIMLDKYNGKLPWK